MECSYSPSCCYCALCGLVVLLWCSLVVLSTYYRAYSALPLLQGTQEVMDRDDDDEIMVIIVINGIIRSWDHP